jgi:hypothetical protein
VNATRNPLIPLFLSLAGALALVAVALRLRETSGAPVLAIVGGEELESLTKAELYNRARAAEIPGRSAMTKAQLVRALRATG